MFVTGLGRVDDQEVLHHANVLVRQDVTVVDGLAGPLLESHANDHGLSHPYPHGVLYGAGGYPRVGIGSLSGKGMSFAGPVTSISAMTYSALSRNCCF